MSSEFSPFDLGFLQTDCALFGIRLVSLVHTMLDKAGLERSVLLEKTSLAARFLCFPQNGEAIHHHSGYSHREPKQSNMAIEVAKERKKTIWLRSIFLSAFIIAIVILVVTTIKMGNSDEQGTSFRLFNHDKENAKQMQMELDELKKENIELKYELEKYKDKYGELDMQE